MEPGISDYLIYAACVSEVIIDVLTGNKIVTRVDLLEDTGNSISPSIDIGQVEGAFIMGLGLWSTELIQFDENGRIATNRTWDYKVPGALDIPVEFRVMFPPNNPNPTGVLKSKGKFNCVILFWNMKPYRYLNKFIMLWDWIGLKLGKV